MLRFTPAQQAALNANRAAFNQRQIAMAGTGMLVGNALPLPREVWGQWDREAVEIQRDVLAVFNTLAASLSKPVAIGKLVHYFQTVSDSGEVNVSLDGRGKARSDQQTFDYHGTPVPIFDTRFGYGWRQVEAARTEGFQLDAAGRNNAFRRIAEQLETVCLDGHSGTVVGGDQLYGLRTHPNVSTRSTGNTLNGATGAQWLAEIIASIKLLHDNNFRDRVTIFLNWDDWFYASNTEYTSGYPKTIAQRVREIEGIAEIVPASRVAADEIIVLVKRRDVVEILSAMPMATRAQFRANPEDDYDFVTMAAAVPQVKYDALDQCGIAYSS